MSFGSPGQGYTWTGTVNVYNALGGEQWQVTVGGVPWGTFNGYSPFGPVQAQDGGIIAINGAGLTPGNTYQAALIGSLDTNDQAQPTGPGPMPLTIAQIAAGLAPLSANQGLLLNGAFTGGAQAITVPETVQSLIVQLNVATNSIAAGQYVKATASTTTDLLGSTLSFPSFGTIALLGVNSSQATPQNFAYIDVAPGPQFLQIPASGWTFANLRVWGASAPASELEGMSDSNSQGFWRNGITTRPRQVIDGVATGALTTLYNGLNSLRIFSLSITVEGTASGSGVVLQTGVNTYARCVIAPNGQNTVTKEYPGGLYVPGPFTTNNLVENVSAATITATVSMWYSEEP